MYLLTRYLVFICIISGRYLKSLKLLGLFQYSQNNDQAICYGHKKVSKNLSEKKVF